MAIFDRDALEENDKILREQMAIFPDETYPESVAQDVGALYTGVYDFIQGSPQNQYQGSGSLSGEYRTDILSAGISGEAAALSSFSGSALDFDTGYQPPETEITGSNIGELTAADPERNLQARRDFTYRYMQMQSSDFALKQKWDRWINRDMPKMDPDEANVMAESLGADIKFDKPVSEFEVRQSVSTKLKRERLQESLALLNSTGSYGFVNDAKVMGSALAGGVGPIELTTSVALGWLVPEISIAALAKGGQIIPQMLRLKKLSDAAQAVRTAKTINNISRAAASNSPEALSAVSLILKNSEAGVKAAKIEKRNIQMMQNLEKLQGLKYDQLTNLEKTGLDSLVFSVVDMPFINAARDNSKELGWDLYSEKDKAMDSLLAAGLGIFLPTGVRSIGRALGISPTAMLTRRLDNMEVDINAKEALGNISADEADAARRALKELRKDAIETKDIYKKPDEYFERMVHDLQLTNVSNETLTAQRAYILNELLAGNRPKIHNIPQFESIMSHVSALQLDRLRTENARQVFGSALFREISKNGLHSVRVQGDTGLLGSRVITGLTEEESLEQLRNMYKGLVLRDSKAAYEFKQWANRYSEFYKTLSDMYARVRDQLAVNVRARRSGETSKLSTTELINVREQMRNAYLKYKLGPEALKVKDALQNEEFTRALGASPEELPANYREVLDEFEELYNQFVTETKDKKGRTLYDFKTVSGKKYGHTIFSDYLDELKHGMDDNSYLAQADDIISTWSQESVNTIIKQSIDLDVSADTDLDHLLGARRQSYEELQRSSNELQAWDAHLAQERLAYNKTQFSPETRKAFETLKRFTKADPVNESHFNRLVASIDELRQSRQTRYTDLKNKIITSLKSSEGFQRNLTDLMNGNDTGKAIQLMFSDILSKVLSESGISKQVGNIHNVVRSSVEFLRREIDEHPEHLESLLRAEDIEALSKVPEFGATPRRIQISAENATNIDNLLKPLEQGLDIAFARAELQAIHDIGVYTDRMSLMLQFPENAAEIITGAATQTISVFRGARRSIEYLSKTAGFYTNDLKNRLRAMESSSVSGQTLLDYMSNSSNQDAITESFINQKFGRPGINNSDADRIAKAILDQEASFLGGFRKIGSSYVAPSSVVKRSKLQYADTAIQDSEMLEMYDSVAQALNINPEEFIASLPRVNEAGEIRIGNRIGLPGNKEYKALKADIRDMQKTMRDMTEIENPVYRKMAMWAFRDFDLDRMFDPDGTSAISLNAIRDAALNGNFAPLINGDLYNVHRINAGLKRIKTSLIGADLKAIDGRGLMVDAMSWVYRFKSSFTDIGAVMRGERSASLDAFEGGIHFKDPDSEMNAARLFGYDNINEHIQSAFDTMFQAYYALDNFGARPIEMVNELVDSYNKARVNDKEFATRIQEYSMKRKDPRPGEKFAITEGAKQSIMENVLLNCGLQNTSPSTATRVLKAIANFLSTSLLVKAGLKSLSDYSTIFEGLITNGMVQGRGEAMAISGKASVELMKNRDLLHLVLGTTVLQQDEVFKKMSNDPAGDIIKVSANAHFVDKFEALSRKYADFMMNDFAQLTRITNSNKNVAGYSIQMAIGNAKNTSYDDLGEWFQYALLRESITREDWDFIRTNLIHDFKDYVSKASGKKLTGDSYNILVPLSVRDLTDDVIARELTRRGELNVTPIKIDEFRREIASKVWNMVDTGADEMVSIPSNRIANILRGGKARNSGWGTVLDLLTQFQSFGAALLFNTYGKRLANLAARETGVSLIDLFNPLVKLSNVNRSAVYQNLFGMMLTVGMTMLIVDTSVSALAGQIQKPIGPDGKIHADNLIAAAMGALGAGGVVMDAALEGIEGSGQRGGGFALQVFPSLSNLLRTGYRLGVPLRSSRVPDSMRGEAFAASVAQEFARFSGLKSAPIISLVYQDLVGAWLDSRVKGGYGPYDTYIQNRENRGMIIMPWERNPYPIWQQ